MLTPSTTAKARTNIRQDQLESGKVKELVSLRDLRKLANLFSLPPFPPSAGSLGKCSPLTLSLHKVRGIDNFKATLRRFFRTGGFKISLSLLPYYTYKTQNTYQD